MKNIIGIITFAGLLFTACSSPSNKRAVDVDDLEKIQKEDEKQNEDVTATRDALSAKELLDLSDQTDLASVQLYMKDRSKDFIHAGKGEFAAQHRSVVKDTSGNELVMPLSTFYVDVNPQASWRAAHTIHKIEIGNHLLEEFHQLGFRIVDTGYYLGLKSMQQRYTSAQYPGKSLYVTSTYEPWYKKGLYNTKVTWPCFVFEVYNDHK